MSAAFLNPCHFCNQQFLKKLITGGAEETAEVWSRLQAKSKRCTVIENELNKQKFR